MKSPGFGPMPIFHPSTSCFLLPIFLILDNAAASNSNDVVAAAVDE